MRAFVLVLLGLALPVSAQAAKSQPAGDGRVQTIDYTQGRLFQIRTAPGTNQTVMFGQGERIQSIVLSVPNSYMIDVSGKGDSFTLRANGAGALTIASVRTDRRTYELELVPGDTRAAPLIVRFGYGRTPSPAEPARFPGMAQPQTQNDGWKVSGNKSLRPSSIRDDGRKTYISWPQDQALPAVFALGPGGKEEMVEGYIRGGVFTIDRVYDRLTFRIDRRAARAQRKEERAGRP